RRGRAQGDDVGSRRARQAQIGDDHAEAAEIVHLPGLVHRAGFRHLVAVALEQALERLANHHLVLDHEYPLHGARVSSVARGARRSCARGSRTVTRVPTSVWLSIEIVPPWSDTML